jgi:hypothetical protein
MGNSPTNLPIITLIANVKENYFDSTVALIRIFFFIQKSSWYVSHQNRDEDGWYNTYIKQDYNDNQNAKTRVILSKVIQRPGLFIVVIIFLR